MAQRTGFLDGGGLTGVTALIVFLGAAGYALWQAYGPEPEPVAAVQPAPGA